MTATANIVDAMVNPAEADAPPPKNHQENACAGTDASLDAEDASASDDDSSDDEDAPVQQPRKFPSEVPKKTKIANLD